MACSEKETALREILGDERVEVALGRSDAELSLLLANQEIFASATRGLSDLSLDTYLLTRGPNRAQARDDGRHATSALEKDALDLLIVAVCARHRLER